MPAHLKDQSVRARRNKAATRAALSADHDVQARPLPDGIEWHPLTVKWWESLWESPMAPEYIDMDLHGLYRVAMLYNDFWMADSHKERAEIQVRLEKADAEYGTNPLARKRLEWQIEATEDAKARGSKRRRAPAPPPAQQGAANDPRSGLYAV